MNELVSVIIPCYNAEKTIECAIQSVVEQTYSNVEIIVINDGSTDSSEDIVLRFKEKNRVIIKLFNQQNLGVSNARNKGIDISCGKYILFLDADDIVAPDMITLLVEALENTDSDVAYCKYAREKCDESVDCTYQIENRQTLLEKQIHKRKYQIGFWTYLYVREIIYKNKISFPVRIRYGEDAVFIISYLLCCDRGVYVDKSLYCYNENSSSAMNNVNWNMTDNLKAVRVIESLLVRNEILPLYYDYIYPRAVWALAKNFAIAGRRDLLERLDWEYQAANYMKKLMHLRQTEVLVKITACLYIINRQLFFGLINACFKFYNKMHKVIIRKRKK